MNYHKDGSLPLNDEVFVFGSNLEGIHGAGAAAVALRYGAEFGHGEGVCGNTYAIPTRYVDAETGRIKTLPLEEVRHHVNSFIAYASAHKELGFFVTRVGCGLAGFRDQQIANLFALAPDNCNLPEPWRYFMEDIRT